MEMCACSYLDNKYKSNIDNIMYHMTDEALDCIELNSEIRTNHIEKYLENIFPMCICEMIIIYIYI